MMVQAYPDAEGHARLAGREIASQCPGGPAATLALLLVVEMSV